MSKNDEPMSKSDFFNIIMGTDFANDFSVVEKINYVNEKYREFGCEELSFTGKALISMFLPINFCYYQKDDKIKECDLYEGFINKKQLGSSQNSFIQLLFKEYDNETSINFINNIQFIANEWLLQNGFSIGIADCRVTKSSEINKVIKKCFFEANRVKDSTSHPLIREVKINAALSKARDNGMRIAKEALDETNSFVSTVTSGSKGDYFNIAQVTGLLGQQNLTGKRIPQMLNNGKRTLPHYPMKVSKEQEYESRGFVESSFSKGLNPREFFFHAMVGREGITDTGMKTATSGYLQRKMIKVAEDFKVNYDGAVRNSCGNVLQMQYGEDSLDASETVIMKGKAQILDVSRMCDKLNSDFENKDTDLSGMMEGMVI